MAHNILPVDRIPRERKELQSLLGEARHKQKQARIKRYIAIGLILVAISLLVWRFAGVHHTSMAMLYLGGLV